MISGVSSERLKMDVRSILLILVPAVLTYCICNLYIQPGEKIKWPLKISELITGRSYINKAKHTKPNKRQERSSSKSSVMDAFKKPSTLWQSEATFILNGSEESLPMIDNKESTSLKVYTRTRSRTGNNLFQYVSTLGIAHHNNRSAVFNPEMTKLKAIFPKIEIHFLNDIPNWKRLFEKKAFTFDPRFFNLPKENMRIGHFFFNFKYFHGSFGNIYNKTLSHFNDTLLTKATGFIQEAKYNYTQRNRIRRNKTKITSVCIHIRRGDILQQNWINYGFIVPSSLDIQNAMNYMQNKFKHTVFIVLSNDLKWSKVNLNRTNVYFSTLKSANEDFVLMCHCEHIIITVGTFGWWGAWFTSWRGGIAMYYEHQFSKNSKGHRCLSRHDYIPPHWLAYTNMTIVESKYLGDK